MTRLGRTSPLTRIYKNLKNELIVLAFCEGMLSTHHLAFFFLYTKHYHLDLLTYTIFECILHVLFYLNPVLGYISDTFSFLGYKKKSYLILVGFLGALGYFFCAVCDIMSASVGFIFAVNFVIELANAFRTVLLDSLCVILHNVQKYGLRQTQRKSSTSSVGLLFGCRLFGKVVSTILFGLLYNHIKIRCRVIRLCDFGYYYLRGIGHNSLPQRA